MYLGQLFRSFRPLHNPLGFGGLDFAVLAIALLFAAVLALRPLIEPSFRRLAERRWAAFLTLACLAVVLRLLLLPGSPIPLPAGADDFSYILLGDTLAHFRLANPAHELSRFFETVFVLQKPTYSSIYPLGQGIVLAVGRLLFGSFWAGVLLSSAALCGLCYWMLRAWMPPVWALFGGLLAVMQFVPLSQWTNSYWGGAVSACAGCLVFGALARMDGGRTSRMALLAGLGLAIQMLTRPFEFLLLVICAGLYLIFVRRSFRGSLPMAAMLLPAALLTVAQNASVTGSWKTLPYMASRYQYGVPTSFTFQPNPVPHRELTPEQEMDYRAQAAIHGSTGDSASSFFERFGYRLRYLRFFLMAPLFLSLLWFLPSLRERRWQWTAASVFLFLAGTNFYPYFFPHYIAILVPLLLAMALWGLQKMPSQIVASLCVVHFCFWYGIHLANNPNLLPATQYETADYINWGDPDGRISVQHALGQAQGKQLVFVRYSPAHRFREWIANGAEIDAERVVWARDLGSADNENLLRHFPDRKAWLLEPDLRPPRLSPYASESGSFESVH
jgi:hypothetical protein